MRYTSVLFIVLTTACGSSTTEAGPAAQEPSTGGQAPTSLPETGGAQNTPVTQPSTGGSSASHQTLATGGSVVTLTGGSSATQACSTGTIGCSCYSSGACLSGLTCTAGTCIGSTITSTGGSGSRGTGGQPGTGGSKASTGGSSATCAGHAGCACTTLGGLTNQCSGGLQCITSLITGPRCWATNTTDPTYQGQAGYACQTVCAIGQTPPCAWCSSSNLVCDTGICEVK